MTFGRAALGENLALSPPHLPPKGSLYSVPVPAVSELSGCYSWVCFLFLKLASITVCVPPTYVAIEKVGLGTVLHRFLNVLPPKVWTGEGEPCSQEGGFLLSLFSVEELAGCDQYALVSWV